MRHEIMIPFEIHTEAIEQKLEKDAYDAIIDMLFAKIEANVPTKWVGYNKKIDYERVVSSAAAEFLNDNRDQLLELAANNIAKRMSKTKAFKEKVGELID